MIHTPGPWRSVYDGSSEWSVGPDEDPQDLRIATVQKCSVGQDGWHEAAANAMLIAAAPDMLAALKELLAAGQFCVDSTDEVAAMLRLGNATEHANRVIAKAEGR